MRVREGGEANDNTAPARTGIESRPRGLGDGVRKVSGAGSGTDDTGELVPDLAGVEVDRADEAMEWDSGLRKPSEQATYQHWNLSFLLPRTNTEEGSGWLRT